MPFLDRHFKFILGIFILIFLVQMWLCSGTLAPYAATLSNPHIADENGDLIEIPGDTNLSAIGCYYIVNYDHKHYIANFDMIDGAPKEQWNWGYLLRRPLLFIFSYPLMKLFGFTSGGFATALLINTIVLIVFTLWVRKRWNTVAAVTGLILLSAYPATMYWSGQPYPHILITACTLILCMLLYRSFETNSIKKIALYSLLAGIVFLAYDLYTYFIPAFILLLVWQRKWLSVPVSFILLTLPLGLWLWFLQGKANPGSSDNADTYQIILQSYFRGTPETFLGNLKELPYNFYFNFSAATYTYLGAFLIASLFMGIFMRGWKPEKPFWVMAVSILAVFVFNNMAPSYGGWQMRGELVARIYQPAFILCLLPAFYIIKQADAIGNRWVQPVLLVMAICVFAFNTMINIAPALGNDSQAYHHYRFYQHADETSMHTNLQTYGRRPMWVCR